MGSLGSWPPVPSSRPLPSHPLGVLTGVALRTQVYESVQSGLHEWQIYVLLYFAFFHLLFEFVLC